MTEVATVETDVELNPEAEADGDEEQDNDTGGDEMPIPPPPPPLIPEGATDVGPVAQEGFQLNSSLQAFEEVYLSECGKERPAPEAKFNYAWALVRSPKREYIRKGITMLQGLSQDRYCEVDCLYYCGVGYYRLDNLLESRRCLETLLEISANCRPAISLLDVVEDRILKDGTSGIVIMGALLASVAAVSVLIAKLKSS